MRRLTSIAGPILFSLLVILFLAGSAQAKNSKAASENATVTTNGSEKSNKFTQTAKAGNPAQTSSPPMASSPEEEYQTARPTCSPSLLKENGVHESGVVGILVNIKDQSELRKVIRKKILEQHCVYLFGIALDENVKRIKGQLEREYRASRDPESIHFNPGQTNFLAAVKIPENYIVEEMDLFFKVNKAKLNLKLFQRYKGKNILLLDKSVALGRWNFPTPVGQFYIKRIVSMPWWYPPAWANQRHPSKPGKKNPYGVWMGELSRDATRGNHGFRVHRDSGIRVHSTNSPRSIGRFASHGCIRLHPSVADELFPALLHYRLHLAGEKNIRGIVHPLKDTIPFTISRK